MIECILTKHADNWTKSNATREHLKRYAKEIGDGLWISRDEKWIYREIE